jgi:hypothetical protein
MVLKSLLFTSVILLSYQFSFGQSNFPYDAEWKLIDSLMNKKNLPKSALVEVIKIYSTAKTEKNEAQWVKAILYRNHLQVSEDRDINRVVAEMDREISTAPPRVAALLKSVEAEQFFQYLMANSYRMRSRTTVASDTTIDFETWTISRMEERIRSLYLGSLENPDLLKKTPMEKYNPLLIKGSARELRPTLYDLLAWRALDYFQRDFGFSGLPDDLLMENPALFSEALLFMHYGFKSKDSTSNQFTAIGIYQQLLKFHAKDIPLDAWIDADIHRIQFVHQYAKMPGKDSLYLNALGRITSQFGTLSVSSQAWFLQAQWWNRQASAYDPLGDTSHRFDNLKAIAFCEKALNNPDSSQGKWNCEQLLKTIYARFYDLNVEEVNIPDLPFRALLTYKNVHEIFGRIIPLNDVARDSIVRKLYSRKFWSKIVSWPYQSTLHQFIPDTRDFQQHRVEFKIGPLSSGQYGLLTSSDSSFNDSSIIGLTFFSCSSISYLQNGLDYFVLNRDSGSPLKGVRVKTSIVRYSDKGNFYVPSKTYMTNDHGYFHLVRERNNGAKKFEFFYGRDYLSSSQYTGYFRNSGDEEDVSGSKEYEKKNLRNFLFTDRSIYRPGQVVYFKGIMVTKQFKSKKYKIVAGKKLKIFLLDVNEQEIDSLALQSNDFGSVHGKFILPGNILNGEFKIADEETRDRISFSVEEYKRPKFYIEYDSVKTAFQFFDSIKVRGGAMAYAGNAIDNASVNWRVVRKTRFPYPWLIQTYFSGSEIEIAHGTTKTDSSGKFIFQFMAIPDKSIPKTTMPVCEYQIEATITSNDGETRSSMTIIPVSDQAFEIVSTLTSESRLDKDSLYQVPVSTKSIAGQFLKELLSVSVFKLASPTRLIRKRYWQRPDQFILSEQDYIKLFPNDEYDNEANMTSWKRGPEVYQKTDSSSQNGFFALDRQFFSNINPGSYLFEFSAIGKKGEKIVFNRYIEITADSPGAGLVSYNLFPSEFINADPGQRVKVHTGSDAKQVFVVRAKLAAADTVTAYTFYNLTPQGRTSWAEIGEQDRGGFKLLDVFVKNNRWYSSSHFIWIPWTNKQLQVNYLTWKDKTEPGKSEQWKIGISSIKKGNGESEILTSMYDASLDQFRDHVWTLPDLYPIINTTNSWNAPDNFNLSGTELRPDKNSGFYLPSGFYYDRIIRVGEKRITVSPDEEEYEVMRKKDITGSVKMVTMGVPGAPNRMFNQAAEADTVTSRIVQSGEMNESVQIRKNFNETAFFQPDLKTDAQGNVEISFTMPEALTRWKWMILAHTKDLAFGYSEKEVVTQKELMVQTNMPRFFREGDTMMLPIKIANLSTQNMNGTVKLEWLDPETNQPADKSVSNLKVSQPFTVNASQSSVVFFPTIIPAHFTKPLLYRVTAETEMRGTGYSDGEEAVIPVLSNRMLVTESMAINMTGKTDEHFLFEKLMKSGSSSSLQNQGLTVEYTTNPAWYAVQSLPYLMEFPYECAEQTFNRFYANALAADIVKNAPLIRAVFEKWKKADTAGLMSNLEKNQELKTALLRETPWVLEAQTESQQKKNIALLFDLVKMRSTLKSALDKLSQMQSGGGGFPWFKGGMDDRYITQYILSGIGRLKKLNAIPAELQPSLVKLVKSGFNYLDKEIIKDYENHDKGPAARNLGAIQIQYLYMRSLFQEMAVPAGITAVINYYKYQCLENWMKQSVYMQGMMALYLHRVGEEKTAREILASLKENATISSELGMYWKTNQYGFYWQDAPIETQSLLIEVFHELYGAVTDIDQMKYWLLQQKHTQHWPTTKATADACYALLLDGSDWLTSKQAVTIKLGNYKINPDKMEAGTGYFKKFIPGNEVNPDMGNIRVVIQPNSDSVTNPPSRAQAGSRGGRGQLPTINGHRSSVIDQPSTVNHQPSTANGQLPTPSWGAVYWQYFENLDKISSAQTQLSITKNLFIEKNSDRGPVLEAVSEKNILRPGDKLIMRIILKTDRDLEYVHLKDMRAACMEPANVLSGYHWQGGLGYYEMTKDASTSFFFDRLPKGVHVFEYPVHVTTAGNYSNGISSLECMYAPEFAAHSEGIRVQVESK